MFELPPPEEDGLETPKVGPWSRDKHYYVQRYIDIFTNGMKNQTWCATTHYIDLFAGAGLERYEDGGIGWGSPLIAAQAPVPFSRLHFCEIDDVRFDALSQRTNRFNQPTEPQLLKGDANLEVHRIVDAIPPRDSLSVAFLDPYGLHIDFRTIEALTAMVGGLT